MSNRGATCTINIVRKSNLTSTLKHELAFDSCQFHRARAAAARTDEPKNDRDRDKESADDYDDIEIIDSRLADYSFLLRRCTLQIELNNILFGHNPMLGVCLHRKNAK